MKCAISCLRFTAPAGVFITHDVDRCPLYPNHNITQRIILVGYACGNNLHEGGSGGRGHPRSEKRRICGTLDGQGYGVLTNLEVIT